MLGMGAGKDNPYILEQRGVANLTPYVQNRLERMRAALDFSGATLHRIRASTQELLVIKEQLRKIITSNSYPSAEKEKARKELREIMAADLYLRGSPRSNYTPIDLKGPDAIEAVLKTLN